MVVQAVRGDVVGDPERPRLVGEEHPDLVERLDVVRHERDGHDEDLAFAGGGQLLQDVGSRGAEPRHVPDLGLVGEARPVPAADPGVDRLHGGFDVRRVRVLLLLDRRERERVGRVEEQGLRRVGVGELAGGLLDPGGVGVEEARLVVPGVRGVEPAGGPSHPLEARRGLGERPLRRRDGVLRVEREDDQGRDAGRAKLLEGLLDGGRAAHHPDPDDGGRGGVPGQRRLQQHRLLLAPAPDRRPPDLLVRLGRLRGPERRDEPGDGQPRRLPGDRDDLRVGEQLVEEGLQILAALGASQLDEEDAEAAGHHGVREKASSTPSVGFLVFAKISSGRRATSSRGTRRRASRRSG